MAVHYSCRKNKALVRARVIKLLEHLVLHEAPEAVEYVSLAGFHALDALDAVKLGAHVVAVEQAESRFRRLLVNVANTAVTPFHGNLGDWAKYHGYIPRPRLVWADFEGGFNATELRQICGCFESGAIKQGDWLLITYDRSPRVMKLDRPFRHVIQRAMNRANEEIAGQAGEDMFAEALVAKLAHRHGLGIRSAWRVRYTDTGKTTMITAAIQIKEPCVWLPCSTEVLPKPKNLDICRQLSPHEQYYLLNRLRSGAFRGAIAESILAGMEDDFDLVVEFVNRVRDMSPADKAWITMRYNEVVKRTQSAVCG